MVDGSNIIRFPLIIADSEFDVYRVTFPGIAERHTRRLSSNLGFCQILHLLFTLVQTMKFQCTFYLTTEQFLGRCGHQYSLEIVGFSRKC